MSKSLIRKIHLVLTAFFKGFSRKKLVPQNSQPLPILNISRAQGRKALLQYELTPLESQIFNEMDEAARTVSEEKDFVQYWERLDKVLSPIGAHYGLNTHQSIALYVRATFSLFEPEEFSPLE